MKALPEKNTLDRQPIKAVLKRTPTELPENVLRRIRETLVNPAAEEPMGVLAGASLTLSS